MTIREAFLAEFGQELVGPISRGLVEVEPSLPLLRGLTPRGEFAIALTSSGLPAEAVRVGAQVAGSAAKQAALARAHARSGWFARNVYKSAATRAAEGRRATVQGAAAAVGVAAVVAGVAYVIAKSGERSDRYRAAYLVDTLLAAASHDAGPGGEKACLAFRGAMIGRFSVAGPKRDELLARELDAGLDSVETEVFPDALHEPLGALMLETRITALGGEGHVVERAAAEVVVPLVKIGMSPGAARSFVAAAAPRHIDGRVVYQEHYQALQAGVARVGAGLGLTVGDLLDVLTRIAVFDPFERNRQEHRRMAADVVRRAASADRNPLPGGAGFWNVIGEIATTAFAGSNLAPGSINRALTQVRHG